MDCSIVASTDLKTALGSRFCMTVLVKTFWPNTSPGGSATAKLVAGGWWAIIAVIAWRRTLVATMYRSSGIAVKRTQAHGRGPGTARLQLNVGAQEIEHVSAR